jgi:hypothetical protein
MNTKDLVNIYNSKRINEIDIDKYQFKQEQTQKKITKRIKAKINSRNKYDE